MIGPCAAVLLGVAAITGSQLEAGAVEGPAPAGDLAGTGLHRTLPREGYAVTPDGVHLYYEMRGHGGETVVVPVGFYLSDLLAPLAEGRRMVFYDPRGRGRSDAVGREAISLDHQINDLEMLRAALGIERMALIGWSGLGMEMAVYALRHPERVTRLVQVAPVAPRRTPWMEEHMKARMSRMNAAEEARLRERQEAGEFDERPADYCREVGRLLVPLDFADVANAARAPGVCHLPNEWPTHLFPFFGALLESFGDYDWRPSLAEITIPRLVIHGAQDPIPYGGTLEWVKGQANARLLVLEGAGHWPFVERPDLFFPAVERFLDGGWPEAAQAID